MATIKTQKGESIVVDDNLFEILNQFTWRVKNNYVYTAIKGRQVTMHRMVVGQIFKKGNIIDHINGNPLDNRRANLRTVDQGTNSQRSKKPKETTNFLGVRQKNKKFATYFCGKYNGIFKTAIEAARHYDELAMRKFGIHALTNRRFFLELVKKLSE